MKPDGLLATDDVGQYLSDAHGEAFLAGLRDAGYAERTLQRRRSIAVSFVRWSRRRRLTVKEIDESSVAAFIGRVPRRSRTRDRVALERATLRRFLRYLRGESGSEATRPWMRVPYMFELERRYVDYLRSERGLAERSICTYAPFVRDLLTWRAGRSGSPGCRALDALTVREFLIERVRDRSRSYTRLLAASVRSFLRFLHLRGETTVDLSPSVPAVRTWHQTAMYPFLSPDDVDRIVLQVAA
jgi:site-specific recombinase XerD